MSENQLMVTQAPDACTLPTVDMPLRLAEWDALLTTGVLDVRRLSPERAQFRLRPDPELAARAAELAFPGDAVLFVLRFQPNRVGRSAGVGDHGARSAGSGAGRAGRPSQERC